MSKRHPDGLSKLYKRYPTNEEITRDFQAAKYDACEAINELREYLLACHKDGLFKDIEAEKTLEKLEGICCWINYDDYCDFELDLPELPKELISLLQTEQGAH